MNVKKNNWFLGTILCGVLIFASSILLNSCKKDKLEESVGPGTIGKVNTTVWGQVVDENNNPVVQARVIVDEQETVTNEKGLFVFNNILVPHDHCYVKAVKTGYFNASRTEFPIENGITRYRIVMMESISEGNFSAGSGGSVSLNSGAKIEIGAAAIVKKDGSTYDGTVYVYARHLSPDNSAFGHLIPGNMEAVRTNHSLAILESYGVLNVELKDNNGQLLQLASGKEATLIFPIPNKISLNAPATIPLWYFDEDKGYWIEEGEATKQGNNYIGKVKHFTPWNCDQPYDPSILKGRVLDCNQHPVKEVLLTIDNYTKVYSDENGDFYAKVRANSPITMEILASDNMGLVSSPQKNIQGKGPNDTTYAGTFDVSCASTIKGNLVDCSQQSLPGYVLVQWDNGSNCTYTKDGNFELLAAENKTANLNVYGSNAQNASRTVYTPVSTATLDVGVIQVCDSGSTDSTNWIYFHFGSDSSDYKGKILPPKCEIYFSDSANRSSLHIGFILNGVETPVNIIFAGNQPGTFQYSGVEGESFYISVYKENYLELHATAVSLTITEYGRNSGDLIKGYFEGDFYDFNSERIDHVKANFSFPRK